MLPEMGQKVCKAMAIVISISLQFNEICVIAQPNRAVSAPKFTCHIQYLTLSYAWEEGS